MEESLGYKRITIKDNTVSANVPNNDIAKLMYYLRSVSSVLSFNGFGEYINYNKYYCLSNQDIITLIGLANKFNPDIMIDSEVFINNEDLDMNNRFIEITDKEMNIHTNREIFIGGIVVKVLKIMLYKRNWLDYFYYWPKNRLIQRFFLPPPPPLLLPPPTQVSFPRYQPREYYSSENNLNDDELCCCRIF